MNRVKWIMSCLLLFIVASACGGSNHAPEQGVDAAVEAHYVKGRVLDESGKPVKGVKILVENIMAWGEAIVAYSDEKGYYKAKLGPYASYRVAYGEITRTLDDRTFTMRVHSEDRGIFTYQQGAVRNLTWKLTGKQTPDAPDYYGGMVQLYYVNGGVNFDYITFRFEPIVLIDGSKPAPFERKVTNGYYIPDIPIGKYKLSATYKDPAQSKTYTLDFRDIAVNPNGAFSMGSIVFTFYPGPDPVNCTNCVKLEFQ